MQPIIPCHRCGYATAQAFPRCWCCGRPLDQCRRAHRAARPARPATRHRRRRWTWPSIHLSWPHRHPEPPKEDLAELIAAW